MLNAPRLSPGRCPCCARARPFLWANPPTCRVYFQISPTEPRPLSRPGRRGPVGAAFQSEPYTNVMPSSTAAPAPPVADPIVVGFSTPKLKSLISKALVVCCTETESVGTAEWNQMNASTAGTSRASRDSTPRRTDLEVRFDMAGFLAAPTAAIRGVYLGRD